MKICFLTFLCLFIGLCFTASAQTEKGSWLFGGNGSFNLSGRLGIPSNQNTYRQFEASLSPTVGFFVFNNLSIGVSIPASTTLNSDYKMYSIGAGPFARYYFGKGRFKIFPEVKFEFHRSSLEFEQAFLFPELDGIIRSTTIGAGPGITYFIAANLAIEGVFSFYTITGSDSRGYTNSIIDRQGLNFNIGFQFYLPNNK